MDDASMMVGACFDAEPREVGTPDVVLEAGATPGPEFTTPPQGRAALNAWLDQGFYRRWQCQPEPHTNPSFSGHAVTRVCMNRLWLETPATQPFPAGAAAVKELYDCTMRNLIGFAVSLKVGPTNTPADWYWFQQLPAGAQNESLPEPIEPDGVVADGIGTAGNAQRVCSSCHAVAGQQGFPGHHFAYTLTAAAP